jgi:hypothetical protein
MRIQGKKEGRHEKREGRNCACKEHHEKGKIAKQAPLDERRRSDWVSISDNPGCRQARCKSRESEYAKCPGYTQLLDYCIQRKAKNCTPETTSSFDKSLSKTELGAEILAWNN